MLALGLVLMLVPARGAMIAAFVLCGLGCAPIYPNIIQDTPVNYGAENSQAAVGVQMASAYIGSTFMPTIFGAMAGVIGYGALPAVILVLTAVMAATSVWQKRLEEYVEPELDEDRKAILRRLLPESYHSIIKHKPYHIVAV